MITIEYLDSLSLPGGEAKINEDALAFDRKAAVVLDGATDLGEPLLPGGSDAAWIARTGAERLLAHVHAGEDAHEAVRLSLHDATEAFARLRHRIPVETWELPFASMMFVVARGEMLDLLWFGDCAAIVRKPGESAVFVGEVETRRANERARVADLAAKKGVSPAAAGVRDTFLASLRRVRNFVNTERGGWLFGPDPRAAEHVARCALAVPSGTSLLLATDGFLALVTEYARYDAASLLAAAETGGLAALGRELRDIERADPEGERYPRFKTSDDATALLLRVV